MEKDALVEKAIVSILTVAVLLQDVCFSAFAVFERKNDVHAEAEITSVVEAQYESHAGNALRLFFPFASPYVIAEFASYLNYRGVPVEGAVGVAGGLNRVVFVHDGFAKCPTQNRIGSIRSGLVA
jgi:hypothetical protein